MASWREKQLNKFSFANAKKAAKDFCIIRHSNTLTKFCLLVLALFTPLFIHFTPDNVIPAKAEGSLAEVYLLGTNASDDNDGATQDSPVATFEKAKSLLVPGGTIHLGGQINIAAGANVTMSLENSGGEPGMLKRQSGFTGIMINMANGTVTNPKTLTLENIIIDGNRYCGDNGEDTCGGDAIVKVGNYNSLNVNEGAILQNNRKASSHGGAIFANATRAIVNINGGIIQNNTTSLATSVYGGGVYIVNSTLNFNSGYIRNNYGNAAGGGIFAQGTSTNPATVTMRQGAFLEGNVAKTNGGGMYAGNGIKVNLFFEGGIIQNNSANQGGGIYFNDKNGEFNVDKLIVRNNTAVGSSGGGIYVTSGTMNLGGSDKINQNEDILIQNNIAQGYGGGLYVSSGQIYMYSGVVSGNESKGAGGGGLNTSTNGKTTIYGGLFTGNIASGTNGNGFGGAIYNSGQAGTETKVLGGMIDSTNKSKTGTSDGIYHSAASTTAAVLQIGDAEIMSNVFLASQTGNNYADIVNTLSSSVLFYVGNPSEGRIVASGVEGYTLTQSDIENILIQTSPNSNTWYVTLNENDEAVLTSTPPNNQLAMVFIDGVNGNNSAAGNTPRLAVKTFAEARRRLARNGVIYIVNTVTVSGNETWELPISAYDSAEIRRYNGSLGGGVFEGDLVEISPTGTLFLTNIVLGGGGLQTSGSIIKNNGKLNIAGLTKVGVDKNDGGIYFETDKIITLTDVPDDGSRFNIEGVAESNIYGRVVGTRSGIDSIGAIANYFHYLPAGARVIPDGNNYILDGAITATAVGLSNMVTGVTVEDAKIVYTLMDGEYADLINPADFITDEMVSELASVLSLQLGTPAKTSPSTVEIPVSGTPTIVRDTLLNLTLPSSIPQDNINGSTTDIPVTGTISITPIKHAGADVTVPDIPSATLLPESLSAVSIIDGLNPGNQVVQYAISAENNSNPELLNWVASGIFTHLEPGATYYVYARSLETESYYAGTPKVSLAVTTPADYNLSLRLTSDSVAVNLLPTEIASGDTEMLVTTNYPDGYSVSMGPAEAGSGNSLVCVSLLSASTIQSISEVGPLIGGSWGWKLNSAPDWQTVPSEMRSIINKPSASGANTNGLSPDKYTVSYGVKASMDNEACLYEKTMMFTAVVNVF